MLWTRVYVGGRVRRAVTTCDNDSEQHALQRRDNLRAASNFASQCEGEGAERSWMIVVSAQRSLEAAAMAAIKSRYDMLLPPSASLVR